MPDLASGVDQAVERPPARGSLLDLLNDVAVALRETDTVTGALQGTVARICEYHGWILGHVYRRAEDGSDVWVPSGIWYPRDASAFSLFKSRTMETRLAGDAGFIGQAAHRASPLWIEDVTVDATHAWRAPENAQLQAAFFLPVTVDGVVNSILEFYSDRALPPESDFVNAMRTVEVMLGNLIRRRALENRVANAAEIERDRIGAELHDTVGQQVAGVELLVRTLQRDVEHAREPDPSRVAELIDATEQLRSQVRELARDIRMAGVPPDRLVESIERLAAHHQRAYGIQCTCHADLTPFVPTGPAATHMYYIAREAVRNAITHGEPNRVAIELRLDRDDQLLVLEIEDDGKGIQPAIAEDPESAGIGLDIMRYRTSLLDGNLTLESGARGGTKVSCTIPAALHLNTAE